MKIYNSDNLKIDVNKELRLLDLSLLKYSSYTKKDFIDKSISLKDNINLKINDTVYTNILLNDVKDSSKIYSYVDSIDYITYLKNETNIKNVLFLNEKIEPWFEIEVSKYVSLTFDPLFSKINKSSIYDNMVYIPRDKNIIKRFLSQDGIYNNNNLNENKLYFSVMLKNIKYDYIGMNGLNSVVSIKYDDYYILSESNVRALKINNMIL